MKSIKKIFLWALCLLCVLALAGCIKINDKNGEEEERILTVYAQQPFYVNAENILVAKWQNGEVAQNASFSLTEQQQQQHALTFISGNVLHSFMPGKISVTAYADGISSQPLEVTVKHTQETLRMALEDIFSDVLLDTNYYLEPHLIDMTAEITNTNIASLTDGALMFQGIGQTDIVIKQDGQTFLTFTASSVNALTQIFLDEMKESGAIDGVQATSNDMAAVKELNLNGKLYNHRGGDYLLSKFVNLEKLHIADCNLRSLSALSNLSSLEYLDASGNLIDWLFPIVGLPLKYLDISDNCLGKNNFKELSSLVSLQTLKVGGNDLPQDFDDIVAPLNLLECDKVNFNPRALDTLTGMDGSSLAVYSGVGDYAQDYKNNKDNLKPNIIIDLSQAASSGGVDKVIIPDNVMNVEIVGNLQKTFNFSIAVLHRQNTLLLIIDNLRLRSPDQTDGISAPQNSYIKLVVKGENIIEAGMDGHGIECGFIEIIGDLGENPQSNSLKLFGGRGSNGKNGSDTKNDSASTRRGYAGNRGGSGIFAAMHEGLAVRRLQTLEAQGGDGGKGGKGGKYTGANTFDPRTWLRKSGDGGQGGKGGAGYLGKGYLLINSSPKFMGGQGGQGGEGGDHLDPNYRGSKGLSGSPGQEVELYTDNN
ncbi:MAG TPA: hypothetical protein GXZ92_04760 [Clostridiales bacterium]|nr:hypothetical protein [Clostridiales bacterium]